MRVPGGGGEGGYFHYRAERGFIGELQMARGVATETKMATWEDLETESVQWEEERLMARMALARLQTMLEDSEAPEERQEGEPPRGERKPLERG